MTERPLVLRDVLRGKLVSLGKLLDYDNSSSELLASITIQELEKSIQELKGRSRGRDPAFDDGQRTTRVCPECGGSKWMRDYDAAEVVCVTCGCVIDEKITDTRPEWRAFDDEEKSKRARAGAPLTYTIHDKGLSNVIDWRDRRGSGRQMTATERLDMYKLRKWQRRVRLSDATERNLAVALSELGKLASTLNLPKNVLETASVIYRRAIRKSIQELKGRSRGRDPAFDDGQRTTRVCPECGGSKWMRDYDAAEVVCVTCGCVIDEKITDTRPKRLVRGRSIHNVTAAAIYMSCRLRGVPRTLDEIASASSLSKKDIGRTYRFMVRELEISVPPLTSRHYEARFSNKLKSALDELFRNGRVEFQKLRGSGPAYKFSRWDKDRLGEVCLYYEFPSRDGEITNRKRVPVGEIRSALRQIVSEGRFTRRTFKEVCPVAESAGPCGFAVVGRCLELLGIARKSDQQGVFELADKKRAQLFLEQR